MTLVEFLEARIAEDESLARHVHPLGESHVMGGVSKPNTRRVTRQTFASEDGYPRSNVDTAATVLFERFGAERVLAECAAKRAIIDVAVPLSQHTDMGSATDEQGWEILEALASVYSDHADFDPAWGTE